MIFPKIVLSHRNTDVKKSEIKCPINYYTNFVASYNLLLSGDVELKLGPGPRVKNNAAKCSISNKAVGTNRKYKTRKM